MSAFEKPDPKDTARINRLQRQLFDRIVRVFEPPLPEGVPERLEQIVAAGAISIGDSVLDVGTGTGILIPLIQAYEPGRIYGCDLSEKMLDQLNRNYSGVETIAADVTDLDLPDASIDVVFMNACYPNIADKAGAFANVSRMMKPAGRLVISHPLGRTFIDTLRKKSPFPLDDFPAETEAGSLLSPFGFDIRRLVDQPELYLLVAVRTRQGPGSS